MDGELSFCTWFNGVGLNQLRGELINSPKVPMNTWRFILGELKYFKSIKTLKLSFRLHLSNQSFLSLNVLSKNFIRDQGHAPAKVGDFKVFLLEFLWYFI